MLIVKYYQYKYTVSIVVRSYYFYFHLNVKYLFLNNTIYIYLFIYSKIFYIIAISIECFDLKILFSLNNKSIVCYTFLLYRMFFLQLLFSFRTMTSSSLEQQRYSSARVKLRIWNASDLIDFWKLSSLFRRLWGGILSGGVTPVL